LSTTFEGVLTRSTALQAHNRFQTALAMRQALTNTGVVLPSPSGGGIAPLHGSQRRGGRWSLVILVFVVLAALVVGIPLVIMGAADTPTVVVAGVSPSPTMTAPDTATAVPPVAYTLAPLTDTPQPSIPIATPTRHTPTPTKPTPSPTRPTATPTRPTPTPEAAAIQAEVENMLLRWSDIHKRAVRQVREDELADILAGEALEKQLGSVRWLSDHNAYWDVTTYARRTDAWEYLTPTWVRVLVWRDEKGDYYQDGKLYPKSSYHEQYRARFVLEKLSGRWYITCKGSLESGRPEPCLLAPP
jgi:hypothetical protein